MNSETFLTTLLKKNLEDARPGKKPFPERNWHYLSNFGRAHHVTALPYGVPSALRDQHSSTQGELERLRLQLQAKTRRINDLRQELSAQRSRPVVDRPVYMTRSIDRATKKVYRPHDLAPDYAAKFYFTRNAAKPLGEDPITGLSRAGSSYSSPLRETGAVLVRRQLRPNFN